MRVRVLSALDSGLSGISKGARAGATPVQRSCILLATEKKGTKIRHPRRSLFVLGAIFPIVVWEMRGNGVIYGDRFGHSDLFIFPRR